MIYVISNKIDKAELIQKLIEKANGVHDFSAIIDLEDDLRSFRDEWLLLASYKSFKEPECIGVSLDGVNELLLQLEFTELELEVAHLPLSDEQRELLASCIVNKRLYMQMYKCVEDFVRLSREFQESHIAATRREPTDDVEEVEMRINHYMHSFTLSKDDFDAKRLQFFHPLGK